MNSGGGAKIFENDKVKINQPVKLCREDSPKINYCYVKPTLTHFYSHFPFTFNVVMIVFVPPVHLMHNETTLIQHSY